MFNQNFSFGKIKTQLENYNFYFSNTFIRYKWFYSNLEYKRYDAKFLFLKYIFKYSLSVMPKLEEKRFAPYINISSTYIDFSGDVSTPTTAAAIYRPADNTLAFSTVNEERLRIDSSGNLGIIHNMEINIIIVHTIIKNIMAITININKQMKILKDCIIQ